MQRRVIAYLCLEDMPRSAGAFPRSSGAGTWSHLQLERDRTRSKTAQNLSRATSQRRVPDCTLAARSGPLARPEHRARRGVIPK